MKPHFLFLIGLLLSLAGLPGYSDLATNWPFATASQYTVSDSNKIEVADGVARLKLGSTTRRIASIAEYTTNYTQVSGLAMGPDTSIGLMKTGSAYSATGTYMSQVLDGGGTNAWQSLALRASNRSLGSHSIAENSPSETNVVALYHFNGSFLDEVSMTPGSPTNLAFSGDAAFGAYSFNNTSNTYFTTVNSNLLDGATEFTMSFWVKPNALPSEGGLLGSYDGTRRLEMFLYGNEVHCNANGLEIAIPGKIVVGTWSFYTATYKSGDGLKLYLNGTLAAQAVASGTITQKAPFVVGWWWYVSAFTRGLFDEVVVYNRALSSSEILDRYNRGASLGVQVRSGNGLPLTGQFVGPDGTPGSFFTGNAGRLKSIGLFDNSAQYMQWRAIMSSDSIRSPYLESVRVGGSTVSYYNDVWRDFQQGSFQGVTNVPPILTTPAMVLGKGNSGVSSNGVFTSRVLDAGSGVNWTKIQWNQGGVLAANLYGLAGLWHMDGSWGDSSTNTPVHNGTVVGGLNYTPLSKIGGFSSVFNGQNSYVNIPTSFGTTLQSAEFWIKTDTASGGILEFGASSPWLAVSNQIVVVNGWSGGNPLVYVNSRQTPQLLPGWNHVAVVFPALITADAVNIGLARGSYFSGQMDELAVYNRALTSGEITEHYVNGRRDAAGQLQVQVRADNVTPLQSTYYLTANGADLSSGGQFSGKRFFQYQALFAGDGTASPTLSGVTVQYGSGQTLTDGTKDGFGSGSFDGVTVRLHGDELTLRPLYSSGPVNLNPVNSPQTLRLWRMDDDSWTLGSATVMDSSGNIENGIPYGDATVVDNGQVGSRCGSFSGSGYISVSGGNLGSSNFTVSAWFKTSTGGRAAVVTTYNGSGQPYYALEINGNGVSTVTGMTTFVISDGTTTVTVPGNRTGLNDGVWHHLSGVRNGQQAHLYVDGLLAGTALLGGGFGSLGSGQITIAKYGTQSIFFSGYIDEVAVHGRALTEGEIGDLAALGYRTALQGLFVGPVVDAGQTAYWETLYWGSDAPYGRPLKTDASMAGLWHFESVSNNLTADATGNGNDGTVPVGATVSANGRFANGLNLSALQQVSAGAIPALTTDVFSAEAWINPSNAPSLIVMQKVSGGPGFTLGTDATGRPYLTVNGVTTTDPDILRARKWNLLCGTYDGQTARLYVNGLMKGTAAVGGTTQNGASLILGSGGVGIIDEAVLYGRVMNTTEALDHYRAGIGTLKFQVRSFTGTPQGNFVGPDGTTNTWFVDYDGSSLAGVIPINQQFQCSAVMATEDARYSPVLDGIRVDASAYPVDNPWVTPADGYGSPFFGNLTSFADVLVTSNSAAVQYQISGNNGSNWYAWVNGAWFDVTGYANSTSQWQFSNSRSVISNNAASFYPQVCHGVGGTFKFRAFLKSDAIQQVALDEVDLGYSAGRLTVVKPNGTEIGSRAWVIGVPYNIQWSSAGGVNSTNIVIDLYDQTGSNYINTLVSGVTNSGSYTGVVYTVAGMYRIKIRDGSDPTIWDLSNPFQLVGNLHLSQPDGGEFWYLGQTNWVRWESPSAPDLSGSVALWFSPDGGTNWEKMVPNAPNATGTNSYGWATPTLDAFLPSTNAVMAVSTPEDDSIRPDQNHYNYDISDNPFIMAGIVVTFPTAGTGLKRGTVTNITWVSAAAGPAVSIALFDGTAWTNLTPSTTNTDGVNSYTCALNAKTPTESALIRVTSLSNAAIVGTSYPFVLADINILAPAAGNQWQIGTTNIVSWLAAGVGDLVDIAYSAGGGVWSNLVTGYTNINSSGSTLVTNYAPPWAITGPPSTGVTVKITATQKGLSTLSGAFDISGVQVVSPNGGEIWDFAASNTVTWLAVDAGTPATLDVAYQDGVTTSDYQTAASALLYTGRQTIPPGKLARPTTLGRVRITATSPPTNALPVPMADISDKSFTIRGLLVTFPSTNSVYTMGTTVTNGIQWYSAATGTGINPANLYYSRGGTNFTDFIMSAYNNDAGTSFNQMDWTVSRSLTPSTTAQVEVVAGAFTAVSRPFSLRGIRITQPAAGQVYDLGSKQTNRWISAAISAADYASNSVSVNGLAGPFVSGGLPGDTFVAGGSAAWTVDPSLTPTTNAVIRMAITRPTDTDIVMYSDPFVLRGAKILSPAAGTNWTVGTSQTVVFVAAGMAPGATANFYYSPDGVAFDFANPVAQNVPISSGINTVGWNIESSSLLTRTPSTNAYLMLTSGTFTNTSTAFTMRGIRILSPVKGDILAVSDLTNTLQWAAVGTTGPFTLSYTVYDPPGSSGVIVPSVGGTSYSWALTTNLIGSNVTVTITDGVSTNESGHFSVVAAPTIKIVSPAAGQFWKVGETNNFIRWTRGGQMTNDFTVSYSVAPYAFTNVLPGGTGPMGQDLNNNYYCNWQQIPITLGPVRIIVVNNVNPIVQDTLDGFQIAAKFNISPLAGTPYALEPVAVNWTTLGSLSAVDFYYTTDPLRGTNSWLPATGQLSGSVGNNLFSAFIWSVPNLQTNTVWFRIQDHTYAGTVFDASQEGPYDDLGMFEVDYFTIVWRILDGATSNDLDQVSVSDSSGWSAGGLTSPITNGYPFGTWNTIWSRQYFNDKIIFNWASSPSRTNTVYLTPSESSPEYHVMANFVYDPSSNVFKTVTWLERSSHIIPDPTECTVSVYDPEGNLAQQTTSSSHQATGIFWIDVPALLERNRPYFAKVEIKYSGVVYTSGLTFTLMVPSDSAISAVNSARDAILGSVSNVNANVTGVGIAQQAFRTDVTNRLDTLTNMTALIGTDVAAVRTNLTAFSSNTLAQLALLTNTIGVIGPTGTNLVTQFANLVESTIQRTSRLLTRPTTVKLGTTLDILYRCRPSVIVSMTVSNMSLGLLDWSGGMSERSGGVYEQALTPSHGLGDYLVAVSDSAGGLDRMIVKVTASEIDDLAGSWTSVSNELALIEKSLTNMSTSVSNVQGSVTAMSTNLLLLLADVTNLQANLYTLTGMPSQVAYLTNTIDQVIALTNMAGQVSILTAAVARVSSLTNMGDQLSYLTNLLTQVAPVTNVIAQVSSLTNLPGQTAYLTNLLTRMGGLTNLPGQLALLTNMPAQLASLTNLPSQLTGLTNVTAQLAGLTNLPSQLGGLTNLAGQVATLTNLPAQMAGLTNLTTQVALLTNLPSQMALLTNLPGQTAYLTNLLTSMGGLTNLTGQMALLTNMPTQLAGLTNLPSQLTGLTNVTAQLAGLTNLPSQLGGLTNLPSQLGGLTNLAGQVATLTNMPAQLAGLTNLTTQVALLTNLPSQMGMLTNLPGQTAYLTNLLTSMGGLTNLAGQVATLTNMPSQLAGLTNLPSQLTGLTNVTAQLAGLTNLPSQLAGLTNLPSQLGSLTNLAGQVATLTNMPAQLAGLTNLSSQLTGLTNLPVQLASLTNLPSQLGGLTNLAGQVATLTNLPSQMAMLTNVPTQVAYLTNVIGTLSGITNIGAQVADMTNAIGRLAGMTNIPNQVSFLTNAMATLTGLTNLTTQVGAMTSAVNQVALLTNIPSQVAYLTNAIGTLSGITNIGAQVSDMTNAIGKIAGLTNLSSQVAALSGLTNLTTEVAAITGTLSQVSMLTNVSAQVALLTNLPAQVSALTNSLAAVTALTNLGSQVSTLTNSISQITALTNMAGQVSDVYSMMAGVNTNVAALASVVATSNLVNSIELRVGQQTDPASSDTLFGRLASVLQNLETVGIAANTAAKKATSARTDASSAASGLQNIMQELGQGRVSQMASDLSQVQQSLQKVAGLVKEVPEGIDTKGLAEALNDTVKKIDQIGKDRGVNLGKPEAAQGGPLTAENVDKLINKMAETKAMMDAMRLLMEETVNKPVVVEWLEGSK